MDEEKTVVLQNTQRWYWLDERGATPKVRSELFARSDQNYLYKASGRLTRIQSWRTWHPTPEKAIQDAIDYHKRQVQYAKDSLAKREKTLASLEAWRDSNT